MRYLTVTLTLSLFVAAARADEPDAADEQDTSVEGKETVQFDGNELVLAYEAQDQNGDTIKEYTPADEKLDSWTRLAAIREHVGIDEPKMLGEQMAKELDEREPPAQYTLLENEETGDVILTFVISPDDESFVEFNVFKYQKRPGGGLLSQQYALRAYGDDMPDFLRELTLERRTLLADLMNRDGLKPE